MIQLLIKKIKKFKLIMIKYQKCLIKKNNSNNLDIVNYLNAYAVKKYRNNNIYNNSNNNY